MAIKHRVDLYKLLPKRPVVAELGVAEGLFSLDMCKWGLSLLYLVDMWECHPEFPGDAASPQDWHTKNYNACMKRLQGFPVEVLRGPTVAMAQKVRDNSLDLCYIDACHSYECVKADIEAYWPKVKKGGIMAFHDYINQDYGVSLAVNEFASRQSLKVHVITENKDEDAGAYIVK